MKRLNLTIIGTFIYLALEAFPCTKYVLDFRAKTTHGKLKIGWSINTGFNSCGFPADEISKHRFIIRIENLVENVFLTDTIDQNYFVLNTILTGDAPIILYIEELGNSNHLTSLLVKPEKEKMPQLSSKIDTLNFYLLNGYFYNAATLFEEVERSDLIDEVKNEYKILFPDQYPKERTYFNSYLDGNSMTMIKMPAVDGLFAFIKTINKLTKNEPGRNKGFKIFAKISHDGRLSDYQVIPDSDKQIFDKAAHQLTFSNHLKQLNQVVIIVGRSKNKKKFTIVNKRALTDQSSPGFRTWFPYRGPVH
jgi:hypothetical protein